MDNSTHPNSREVECRVCGDKASGKHYGVPSCDGCRGFFKRSIRRNLDYVCKESGNCVVDVTRRNQCQSCRFKKCLQVNMKRDAVQHERAPRASGMNKVRLPFQTFSPVTHHGQASLFFPASATSAFKHGTNSNPNLGLYHPSSSFIHAAAVAAAAAAVVSHQSPVPLSTRQLLHFSQSSGSQTQQIRSVPTTIIPTVAGTDSSLSTSTPNKEKPEEEEVSTTTNTENLEFYHPSFLSSTENVYESAAKLLFLSIKWARSVPSFGTLPASDQASLLEHSWSELFILSAVQWGLVIEELFLIGRTSFHVSNARRLSDVLNRIGSLNPDHTELACMKAVVLFKPEAASPSSQLRIELLQDQTMLMLQEYCYAKTPMNKVRFGKLLLTFPHLKTVTCNDLEELFFKQTVGEVSIRKLISDLVKSAF